MKNSMQKLFIVFLIVSAAACDNKDEKVKSGVLYASRALQEANANPLSRATYQNLIGRGQNALDYIKYITPKDDPMLALFEYDKPTKPYTVVIRPGGTEGEYFIAGYGKNLKEPIQVETVTVKLPEE
jgi:hypothetical protein